MVLHTLHTQVIDMPSILSMSFLALITLLWKHTLIWFTNPNIDLKALIVLSIPAQLNDLVPSDKLASSQNPSDLVGIS